MKLDDCGLKPQILQFEHIRQTADKAYADLVSDTTEENREKYRTASEDYLYAQLYLLIRLRHYVHDRHVEMKDGYLVWDGDWPNRVHIVNTVGRDRCDRCHGQKTVETQGFFGSMWVECMECNATGKEFVSLVFRTKQHAS